VARKLTSDEREEFPQSDFSAYPVPKSAAPEVQVGPQNALDEAAELGSKLGSATESHQIIRQVRSMYPQELVTAAVMPLDQERTDALDESEVESKAKGVLAKGQKVVPDTAKVRGRGDKLVVVFLVEGESGRTGRAMVPYEDLSKSQKAHEAAQEDGEEKSSGSRRKREG
jgi:hypothetical protein